MKTSINGLSPANCQSSTNNQITEDHSAASAEGFHPGLQEIQDAWADIRDAWTDINAERHDLMLLRQQLESQHRALSQPLLQPPPPQPPAAPAEGQPGGLRFRGNKGCWNCDSYDHVKANCPQPPRPRPKMESRYDRTIRTGIETVHRLLDMMHEARPSKRKREADDDGDQPYQLPIRAAPSGVSAETTPIKKEE